MGFRIACITVFLFIAENTIGSALHRMPSRSGPWANSKISSLIFFCDLHGVAGSICTSNFRRIVHGVLELRVIGIDVMNVSTLRLSFGFSIPCSLYFYSFTTCLTGGYRAVISWTKYPSVFQVSLVHLILGAASAQGEKKLMRI